MKGLKELTFGIIVVDSNIVVVVVYGEVLFARINFQNDAHVETAQCIHP